MTDGNILYKSSSNELMQARFSQSQISQKEFELKLLEINNQYSPYNTNNSYVNSMRKYSIESEIALLINKRNNHIFNAINYALLLADFELSSKSAFSMACLAVSSINSFLTSEKISVPLPVTLQPNISQLYNQLVNSQSNHSLALELKRLKDIFHISY